MICRSLSLLASIGRLLRRWWRADRIRISPTEGRVLRLPVPCFVRIAGRMVKVQDRPKRAGAWLIYTWVADYHDRGQLWVRPGYGAGSAIIRYIERGNPRPLTEADIDVFAADG